MAGSIAPLVLRVYGVASAGALAFVLLGSALWAPADAHWMFRVHVSLLSVAFLFAAPTAALAVVARQASGSAEERWGRLNGLLSSAAVGSCCCALPALQSQRSDRGQLCQQPCITHPTLSR